ncbi:MAG: PTS sugar transporter subunit IIA [Spirochaetaceae bacterium]|jgi:PTS system fructose-specific IIC component/PTS system nitrogen regulatory IIA component|nr:PTS sugar transporter subunit IIA [Spirochaetaceae bacterium]
MFLCDLFPPQLIKVGLESEDKDEVFEELVDFFCQLQRTDGREEILGAIRARELKMSTGIRKGIAVPHGQTDAVERIYGVLGISRRGIEYDSLDGEPVHLIFMILAPHKDSEKHLRLLKRLNQLLDNETFFRDLVGQGDAQGAAGLIKKYEDILIALD